ncbi:MAG: ABC transporter permease [Chloroflexota bacterium]|nr:ABC transporter permease [Chloroflexota bacterium]
MAIGGVLRSRQHGVSGRAWQPGRVPRPSADAAIPWLLPLLILLLWQLSLSLGVFKLHQLPAPLTALSTAWDQLLAGRLQQHTLATLGRVFGGFLIGSAAALVLGTCVGLWRTIDRAVDPTLQALRTIPTLAWAPLLLLWMGIEEAPKLTLVAIGAFFPVYVNLVAGVRGVDRKLVEVGRVYDLSWWAIARRIILPASLPNLLTGLRLGLSQAWLFVVVAELIAATRGLGFMLTDSQNLSRVDLMIVAMLALALLGKLSDMVLRAVEERLLGWRDTFAGTRT